MAALAGGNLNVAQHGTWHHGIIYLTMAYAYHTRIYGDSDPLAEVYRSEEERDKQQEAEDAKVAKEASETLRVAAEKMRERLFDDIDMSTSSTMVKGVINSKNKGGNAKAVNPQSKKVKTGHRLINVKYLKVFHKLHPKVSSHRP